MKDLKDHIVRFCLLFEGVSEIGSNEGWENIYFKEFNMTFQQLLETVGWKMFQAWCAYFAEAVWKLAYSQYDSTMISVIDKLFSGNAVQTWKNFKEAGWVCDDIPEIGAIVVYQRWKNGKPTTSGHMSICFDTEDYHYKTMDGNTSSKSEAEGDQVARRRKKIFQKHKENGLNRLGVIHPKT